MENIKENTSPTSGKGAVKGLTWLVSIVGVFGVCLLFSWLVSRDNSAFAARSESRAASALLTYSPQPAKDLLSYSKHPGNLDNVMIFEIIKLSNTGSATTAKAVTPARKVAPKAVDNSAYDDRIEREAREVIHGDFGNNPGRKAQLGADYAAVQARVNQILHKS